MAKKPSHAELVAEMQQIVRMAAEPRQPVDGIKAAIGRASRALGLPYRRTMTLWYGYTDKILVRDEEAARLRAEGDRLLRLRLARLECEAADLRRHLDRGESRDEGNPLFDRAPARAGPLAAPT